MDDNLAATPNFFDGYTPKGLNKRQAQLLYNVGLNAAGLANIGDAGNTNARTFQYTPDNGPRAATLTTVHLTTDVGLTQYVLDRSFDKDPRVDAGDQD